MNKGLNLLVTFIPSCLLQDWKLLPNFLGLGCLFCFHFFVVLVFCGIYRIVITGFCLRENNWLLHPSSIFAVNKDFGQVGCSWSCSRNQAESRLYCLRACGGFVAVQVPCSAAQLWFLPQGLLPCALGEPLAGPASSACIAALVGTVQALKSQCWSFSLCRSSSFINFSSFSMQDIFLCFPDLSSCKAWNLHMLSISIH